MDSLQCNHFWVHTAFKVQYFGQKLSCRVSERNKLSRNQISAICSVFFINGAIKTPLKPVLHNALAKSLT